MKFQRTAPNSAAGTPPYATCCTFCEQCLFLERAGVTGAGFLIWLPEISQVDINHIARASYVAKITNKKDEIGILAGRAIDALNARRADAKKRLGSDDPMLLATIMLESLNDDEREAAITKLKGIRLLPSDKYWVRGTSGDVNQFPAMAKYWSSAEGPYGKMPPAQWQTLFQQASSSVGNA